MAGILADDAFVLISISHEIIVYDLRNNNVNTIKIEPIHTKSDAKNDDTNNKKGENISTAPPKISAIACSSSKKYLGVSDDRKGLFIYDIVDDWKLINSRFIPKRCTALKFTKDDKYIIIADKSGDVLRVDVTNESTPHDLLVGHVSMLLDLELCDNDKYLVTCDRDEKIRVSNYPNCYNIHQFCLSHTDFVSKVLYIEDQDLLLSGSGDGKIMIWDYKSGHQLDAIDCLEYLGQDQSAVCPSSVPGQSDVENVCRGVDVKNVCYDRVCNLVFVIFEKRSQILQLKTCFQSTNNQTSKSSAKMLKFVSVTNVNPTLQDVSIYKRFLLVLSGDVVTGRISLSSYTIDQDGIKRNDTEVILVDDLNVKLLQINVSGPILSGNRFECSLHKVRIDNMTEYVERKKQRMTGDVMKKRMKMMVNDDDDDGE